MRKYFLFTRVVVLQAFSMRAGETWMSNTELKRNNPEILIGFTPISSIPADSIKEITYEEYLTLENKKWVSTPDPRLSHKVSTPIYPEGFEINTDSLKIKPFPCVIKPKPENKRNE